ncbi:lactonase family protein [Fructobacillus fructosus]|uniref:lactonase family protein n=1 Tax=Fructobacillus fructosus TaxID=1631 RepID=UPI00165878D9|nr:lactonase family protein [Fructobacillus fructosus]MBC9118796.1 lactonase family protein [Fructobacillus fructosus]MBD9365460.1 lactonase family protein [Leuconostoc mesenteroides]CAK1236834.1 6-phosphogluconolactonase [Fructobacillus fructosus]
MIEKFLIGTYTINDSEGIFEVDLDTDRKVLENAHLVAKIDSPTYLAESKKHIVYAVDRNMEEPDLRGGVATFDFNQTPAELLQEEIETGTSDAYVAIDEERQLVFTANYHMGYVSVYAIQDDGRLRLADRVQSLGDVGPRPQQADGAHPHYANLTPDGRLIVCDLGTDRVHVYDISDEGKLTAVSELKTTPGFGPRNISFVNETNLGYLVGELASQVSVVRYNPQDGSLTILNTYSTIPSDWTAHNGAAAIKISHDQRFVYITNRGHDSIAVFAIVGDGELSLVERTSSEGEFPRDFNFSADESLLIVANQNSDNMALFERDQATGRLTLCQKDFAVPEGTCVMRRL